MCSQTIALVISNPIPETVMLCLRNTITTGKRANADLLLGADAEVLFHSIRSKNAVFVSKVGECAIAVCFVKHPLE